MAAAARSPALTNRRSRSFAIARAITSSSASGSSGRDWLGRGGGSEMCAHIFASSLSAGNGTRPVSIWNRTAPSA